MKYRNLLDEEELSILKSYLEDDPNREKYSFQRDDGKGKKNTYLAWNHPGSDVTGMIARSEKVAGTFEKVTYKWYGFKTVATSILMRLSGTLDKSKIDHFYH